MSWLARSFADSLRLDSDDDTLNDVVPTSSAAAHPPAPPPQPPPFPSPPILDDSDTQSEEAQSRGVKEDLSELGQTLTRQFWGVASFLAPPATVSPEDPDSPPFDSLNRSYRSDSSEEEETPETLETPEASSRIQSDFAEIGGRFRSGVSEISRMASNLIREEEHGQVERSEEDEGEVLLERDEEPEECFYGEFDDGDAIATVGVTHEVLTFARNIAMHPETWLDFPLDEEEDPDDFDMSEAQREHAFAIEQFSPRLAALRFELCPCHMSLGYFWKVYFVLLHSRLNKADADVLSTPQVMEARAKWMQELHEQTKPEPDYSARTISNYRDDESNSLEDDDDHHPSENIPFWSFSSEPNTDHDTEKHPVVNSETPLIDKSIIEEEHVSKTPVPGFEVEEEDDQWLEDEDLDLQCAITVGNEEDVSFSDLEDDNDIPFSKPKSNTFSKDFEASLKKS